MTLSSKHYWRTPDQQRRLSGVDAAAILSNQCSVAEIMKIAPLLNHADPVIREGAVSSLVRIGGPDAASQIAKLLGSSDSHMRTIACESLGQIRALDEKSKLYDSLQDHNPNVRCAAAVALRQMGDQAGLPTVILTLRHKGEHQIYALRCLNDITGRGFPLTKRGVQEALRWARLTKQGVNPKSGSSSNRK